MGLSLPTALPSRCSTSLIRDPVWDEKFSFLIDGRMTFMNESFFHVLRKWGNKHWHFSRFYSIAIWCTVLQWNEKATRPRHDIKAWRLCPCTTPLRLIA